MRRLVETAVCIVAALLLVGTWLVEPYSVVSGSMHPTLHGPHRAFVCPHCLQAVTTAADFAPIPDRPAYCPRCKRPGPIEDRLPIIAGDGLLVDRTAFWYRTPQRGEIAYESRRRSTKTSRRRHGTTAQPVGPSGPTNTSPWAITRVYPTIAEPGRRVPACRRNSSSANRLSSTRRAASSSRSGFVFTFPTLPRFAIFADRLCTPTIDLCHVESR
jgi:signal peptidase I